MSTAAERTGGPSVGLPEGVYLAPLNRRLVAFAIDALLPYIFVFGAILNLATGGPGWLSVILVLLPLVWALFVWASCALAAAGPGMKLMGLQLVGMSDGRPIGWRRALIRAVILSLLSGTGVLLIVMAVLMLGQPRRQGWHDLAVDSVVIEERPVAPPRAGESRSIGEWLGKLFGGSRQRSGPRAAIESAPSQGPESVSQGPEPTSQGPEPTSQGPEPVEGPEPTAAPSRRTSLVEDADDDHGWAGAVPAAPQAEDAPATTVQPAVPAEPADQEPAPLPPNQGWVAVLDDGREIPVTGLLLFGRNPQSRPGEEPRVIKVVDSERTVSKTHLAVTVDSRGVLVTDRGSTNGSAITDPYGSYQLLTAEEPVRIPAEGYTISFGKHHLRIVRQAD